MLHQELENTLLRGLEIKGIGELGFPLNPIQIEMMKGVAHKAPFGKGSQTIVDTKVRSAWEIDASEIVFLNAEWDNTMNKISEKVQKGLGIEDHEVVASLYKLLIYEEGDFFLPHKDSEKEKGMFGTMVIGLPSKHTGGEMSVRFGKEEEIVDFSVATANYTIPYVAFYADCDHEIRSVTSGYRVWPRV